MKLGELIKAYRKHKGLSGEALAKEIGVDPISLWRLEEGKTSGSTQWPAVLAWVFGVNKK